jgi:uncharacterized membrane protein YjgN (DUF898 family)
VLLAVLVSMFAFPLFLWMLKKYQHDHYALGQIQTELRTGAGSFYAVALKTLGVCLLAALVAGVAVGILGGGLQALMPGSGRARVSTAAIVAVVVTMIVIYAVILLVVQPYVTSRLQNLVWSRTRHRHVRFESQLYFWPLLWLTLKNWLLIIVTLGLYGPFAKIATARMRLQAVTVHMLLAPDELVSLLQERANDASGDAAGDLLGIDIGL